MVLRYASGPLALLSCAIRTGQPNAAVIVGTAGQIRVDAEWWRPTSLTLARAGQPEERIEVPATGNGYNYEAEEVGRCLRAGRTESETMPLDESIAIMRALDTIRAQWGLRYPSEA
jgi:hypothetical protein